LQNKALILALLTLLILTACSQSRQDKLRQQIAEQSQSDFEKLCYQNNDMWMKMQPVKNSQPTGEPPCFGCMHDGQNHYCDMNEYKKAVEIN